MLYPLTGSSRSITVSALASLALLAASCTPELTATPEPDPVVSSCLTGQRTPPQSVILDVEKGRIGKLVTVLGRGF
jgi:hypothetical protein